MAKSSELLRLLYAAPLDAQHWQNFLNHLGRSVSFTSGYLIISNAGLGTRCLAGGGEDFDPNVLLEYNRHYAAIDPFRAPLFKQPRVGVFDGQELVPYCELHKTELWNGLLSRNRLGHLTLASCTSDRQTAEVLSLWRRSNEGAMDQRSTALLAGLLPHLRTALRLREALEVSKLQQLASEAALEASQTAALLVGQGERLLWANTAAQEHLRSGDGLLQVDGRLLATDTADCANLRDLISRTVTRDADDVGLPRGGLILIRRLSSPSSVVLTVLPLASGSCFDNIAHAALILIHDRDALSSSRATSLRLLYHLSPAEAHLADLLLAGLDLREAATRMRVTTGTARFHLKRVFRKTGTRRQSELIRIMLSLPGPQPAVG